MTALARLFDYVELTHPRLRAGIKEAQAVNPVRFEAVASLFLGWAEAARTLPPCVDAYARFCSDVNLAQARYETAGHYPHKSHAECEHELYAHESMTDYLWGVYLTNVLWAHHFELLMWFEDRFVRALPPQARLIELAPGHGGWGLHALHHVPKAQLQGFDIAPASIVIATSLARAAALASRCAYTRADITTLTTPAQPYDAGICCFLLEHLEQPARVFEVLARHLRPRGRAFVTGALTAAQVDHIFEFVRESELCELAEAAGFRVVETMSLSPQRTLRGACFVPRSMGLIVERLGTVGARM